MQLGQRSARAAYQMFNCRVKIFIGILRQRDYPMKNGISTLASFIGLVLNLGGLFLPWGERKWILGIMGSDYFTGVKLTLGQIALVGCIVTAVSLSYHILRNQRYSLIFALLGELVTLICSLTWIINPGALIFSGWPVYYEALYGAYVTFIGSILVSANATFNLLRH